MKTATVRQVRHDFSSVLQWVADGESVEVSKRGQVVAVIKPPERKRRSRAKRPDFFARFERIYGKDWRKRPAGTNSIVAERQSRPY